MANDALVEPKKSNILESENMYNSHIMIHQDNTRVSLGNQNFNLYKYGLKLLVRWSGGQITNWVGQLIDRKASHYSYMYNNISTSFADTAYDHLDTLIDNSLWGNEPDGHKVHSCWICRQMLFDIFNS